MSTSKQTPSECICGWELQAPEVLYRAFSFDLCQQRVRRTETNFEANFYSLQAADWVHVIALTEQQEVVFIEQFRPAAKKVVLELPGGMTDPEDSSMLAAAVRELREETGYTGNDVVSLGSLAPNYALLKNHCHTFLVKNARLTHPTEYDPGEDIKTVLIPLTDVPKLIDSGELDHALVVSAFFKLFLRLKLPLV